LKKDYAQITMVSYFQKGLERAGKKRKGLVRGGGGKRGTDLKKKGEEWVSSGPYKEIKKNNNFKKGKERGS